MKISQINHSEFDPDHPIDMQQMMQNLHDSHIYRLFEQSPAVSELPDVRQLSVARHILLTQEVAANKRHAYYSRYIGALGVRALIPNHSRRTPFEPSAIPSIVLQTFANVITTRGHSANDHELEELDPTKGVSAELGYVSQYGDWRIDQDLTKAMNKLPNDEALSESGVVFTRIYDALKPADVRYKFLQSESHDDSLLPNFVIARVRPVADARIGSVVIQLVKRSTFSVMLDQPSAEDIGIVQQLLHTSWRDEQERAKFRTDVGEHFIGRAIEAYRNGNYVSDTFPAESLYFAIMRHKTVK